MITEQTVKEIKVNEDSLREVLKGQLENARDFDMSGWRIPIYVDENGDCSFGSWLSNNSSQPNEEELPKVVCPWTMRGLEYEEFDVEDVDYEIELIIDWYIANVLSEEELHLPNKKYTLI